jgi:TolB protein
VSGTPVLVELLVTCAAAPAGAILVDRNQAIERISPEAGTAEIAVASGAGGRWSPDRSRIVYSSTGASGSRVTALTLGTAAPVDLGEGKDPSWSPDGQRITFVRSDGLYVMDADGSDARLVVELSGIANPVWSPDGSLIAFARTEPGRCTISILLVPCPTNLHLVRPDGAALIKLTTDGGRQPAWSPSGSHLVFVRGGGFFVAPPRLVRLDVTARVEQTVWSGGSGASSPVWSPDGAYLAFQVSIPGATSDVLLLPLAGGRSVFLHQPDATPTSWR